MRAVTIVAVILAAIIVTIIVSVATATSSGGLPQTDRLYVTSTQDWSGETATPALGIAQDGVLNQIDWELANDLFLFMQAEEQAGFLGVITPQEQILFNSYWETGSRVNEAYATFKFYVDGVLICQDGDDNTAGVLLPSEATGIRSGSCSPSEDVVVSESSVLRYEITVWGEDIQGGGGPNGPIDRTAVLAWDTTTADTWMEVNSIMPSEVTLVTDQSSYEQTETVTASGQYSWLNGTAISGSDVTVRFYDSTNALQQETTVQTDGSGQYSETYTVPDPSEIGSWKVNVTAEYDAEISATNETFFDVTELAFREINVSTDQASYEQEETVSSSGFFVWSNGTAISDANVTVSFVDSDSVVVQERNVTTDSFGAYSDSYVTSELDATGIWSVNVTGHDAGTTTSNQTTFELTALPQRDIVVSTEQPTYVQNDTAVAFGDFFWDNGTAISGAEVTVTFIDADLIIVQERNVTTNITGGFTDTYEIPIDASTGTWSVEVLGHDDSTTTFNQTSFVLEADTTDVLSVQVNQSSYEQSETVFANGTYVWANGTAIANQNITLTWIDPDMIIRHEENTTTNSLGEYSDSYTLSPSATTGLWTLQATGYATTETTTSTTFEVNESQQDTREITISTNQASYEQEETVVASGLFSWDNGTVISDANVTVSFVDSDSVVVQERNVTTNATGGFTDSYVTSLSDVVGIWDVQVTGHDDGTTTSNQTTFELTQAAQRDITVQANQSTYLLNQTARIQGDFFWDNGTAIVGEEVTVSFIDSDSVVVQERNVTTNATGGYTDTYLIPESALTGTWSVNVTGYDDATTTLNQTTFIVSEEEVGVLVIDSEQESYEQLETAVANGTYLWPNGSAIVGATVTVSWFDSGLVLIREENVTTNATGGYTDSLSLSSGAATGTWTLQATGYEGEITTTNTTFEVTPAPTREITVSTDQASYEQEETVVASGLFSWDNGTAIVGEEVTVSFVDSNLVVVQERNVTTDSFGAYSDSYVTSESDATGIWSVNVTGHDDGTTTSNQTTFELTEFTPAQPTISVQTQSSYVQNDTAIATGSFVWDNGTAISDANVTVRWINPSSSTIQEQNVTTSSSGEFSDSFDTTGSELGEWTIEVDGWLEGSIVASDSTTFNLLDAPPEIPEGSCIGVYVEKGPNWQQGLIQRGDVFEYVCDLSSPLRSNQQLRLELLFPNAQLTQQILAPRLLMQQEVLFP